MQAAQDMLTPPMEIDIPFVPKSVETLILWRDVKKSGLLFGACTALSLFFFITMMSLATFICYAIALGLIVCTAWSKLGGNFGKPMPELPSILREGMSEVDYKVACDRLKPDLDNLTGVLNGLVKCKDLILNGKIIGSALIAGQIFSYIPPGVLSYLVVLFTFTVPKLYEMNKEKVDEGLVVAQGKFNEGVSFAKTEAGKMMDKAPPGVKRVVDKFSSKKAA